MANRAEALVIHFTAITLVLVGLLLASWLWWPYAPVLTFHETHVGVVHVKQGEPLVIERRFHASQDVYVKVMREVIDADGVRHGVSTIEQLYREGENVFLRGTPLPKLMPGRYVYTAEASYDVNPLRTLHQRAPDIQFEIIP